MVVPRAIAADPARSVIGPDHPAAVRVIVIRRRIIEMPVKVVPVCEPTSTVAKAADEKPAIVEGAWDRDKLVLISFPDEAAFHAERIFRLSGIRLAARKCAQSIICAYSDRKTGIHFCGIRAADSPEYLEISKDRKAGAQAIVLLAKGFAP